MSRNKFKVPVAEIEGGTIINLRDLKSSELDLGKILAKEITDITADISLKNTAIGITADFVVRFNAVYECVRCLDRFVNKSVSELLLVYTEGRDPLWGQDNIKLKAHDSERIYYTGPFIDLRPGIREAIILAIPISALCSEDCPGLCSECGKKKNSAMCKCQPSTKRIFPIKGEKPDQK